MACLDIHGGDEILYFYGSELKVISKSTSKEVYAFKNEYTSHTDQPTESQSADFIQHCFSASSDILAAITDDKKLLVWNWKEKTLRKTIHLIKRPTCLSFCKQDENCILVGDKYGDVYKCSLKDDEDKPKLLLGHLSMVLDMVCTEDRKYIITADRDEKIRVSLYPNAYSIHSYCLGHTKLISKMKLLSNNHLLSCSADSSLRLWNYESGEEIQKIDLTTFLTTKDVMYLVNSIVYDGKSNIFVMAEKSDIILHFKYDGSMIELRNTIPLPGQPLSMCLEDDNIITLLLNKDVPLFIYSITNNVNNTALENSYKDILEKNEMKINTVKPSLAYTNLVNPDNLKRPTLITPEATINIDSTAKKQRPNPPKEENIAEE